MQPPSLPSIPPPSIGRWAVGGAGAVGCFYGGRRALAGQDVHFLMRGDYDAVRRNGLNVRSAAGDFHLPRPQIHRDTAAIGPCDLVIIALKSTQNTALASLLPPLLKDDTALLTLQNGLGNEEFLAAQFPGRRILGGLCFVCINRTAPGEILHVAQGQITLGEHGSAASPLTHSIAAAFNEAGIPSQVDDSLARARWKKLVWNIPFNGLSIAGGCIDTAAILASEPLSALVEDLMLEIIATANALGHALPVSLAGDMIRRTRTMSEYKPSSLIDFVEGREVEIDAIWGEPALRARAAGHAMPRVEMLLHLLQAAVERRPLSP